LIAAIGIDTNHAVAFDVLRTSESFFATHDYSEFLEKAKSYILA